MAKKKWNNLFTWVAAILTLIISVGVGGLFVNGTFLNVVLLSYLPAMVHTVVGYVIIVLGIATFIKMFF